MQILCVSGAYMAVWRTLFQKEGPLNHSCFQCRLEMVRNVLKQDRNRLEKIRWATLRGDGIIPETGRNWKPVMFNSAFLFMKNAIFPFSIRKVAPALSHGGSPMVQLSWGNIFLCLRGLPAPQPRVCSVAAVPTLTWPIRDLIQIPKATEYFSPFFILCCIKKLSLPKEMSDGHLAVKTGMRAK